MKNRIYSIKAITCLAVILFCAVTSVSAAISDSERAALIALYNATGGDNWHDNSGWKDGVLEADGFGPRGSEGNWFGIKLAKYSVCCIEIFNNNMTGQLPPEIAGLPELAVLDLHSNKLSGTIPAEIGNLVMLQRLFLGGNPISGSIPEEIGNLTRLKYLNLISTSLEGPIPAEIGNLTNLEELHIYYTSITGPLPAELGNLGQLDTLYLFSNKLTGSIPPELGNLVSVTSIVMYDNQLGGAIPAELGNLPKLRYLNLHHNQLTGPLPPELSNAKNLNNIELGFNQITGSIPAAWGDLSNLSDLSLDKNQLNGSIPAELGNLPQLIYMSLSHNQLSGNIPPELGASTSLTAINLSHNILSGTIPPELGNIPWLYDLDLSQNHLTGTIPSALGNLTYLQELRLSSNQLTGEIPSTFTALTNLWQDFSSLDYNGLSCNNAETLAFLNIYFKDWRATQTVAPTNISVSLSGPSAVKLQWTPICYTNDAGGYLVYYQESGGSWIYAGRTSDKSVSSFEISGLTPDTNYYFSVYTLTEAHALNSNSITSGTGSVSFTLPPVYSEQDPPFGSFDTPLNGSAAAGSIPVTGWALDDSGFASVKIYRHSQDQPVFIGDAVFVEGARPDVAAAFPDYPYNTKAGWGYMLLTNFLPNSGNGTFVLEAIATDPSGKSTSLGTKTIICDNAGAVLPFGAIDAPVQGGLASGNAYINWGWALTPPPNTIPRDGSTIDVWVDGVNLGHPVYDNFRQDISNLFPGYVNSDGAVGYFYLDTTSYADGVHTIQWTVRDDAGNFDGIGSRYFTIQNSSNRSSTNNSPLFTGNPQPATLERFNGNHSPIAIRKGYDRTSEPLTLRPDENGILRITIKPVERLEILFQAQNMAQHIQEVRGLQIPAGSTVTDDNIFMWQPGPAHLGVHRLVFLLAKADGQLFQKEITVIISPQINKTGKTPEVPRK